MAIARYYVQRLPLANPPSGDALIIKTPNPWTWARIRGDSSGGKLTEIKFKGDADRLILTVAVSQDDRHLEKSRYEILIGDADSRSDEEALLKPGQTEKRDSSISLDNPAGYAIIKADRDPPPPPNFDWQFDPPVNIT